MRQLNINSFGLKFWGLLGLVFFMFAQQPVLAQETSNPDQIIEELIEEIAQTKEGDFDYSDLVEQFNYYLLNPINLNSPSQADLENLHLLSDFQIQNLLNYIDQHGGMATIYELQLIEGFNYPVIKRLLPFVSLSGDAEQKKVSVKDAFDYGHNEVFARTGFVVQKAEGYTNVSDSVSEANPSSYFEGNRLKLYTKYKFQYKDKMQFGLTAEKDAGEAFFNRTQTYGFDFYSAHLQINDMGFVKTLVVGDFQALFGQGLVLWGYMAPGKSSYVLDVRKKGQGLKKYSSAEENQFFRGVGSTLAYKNINVTVFGSYKAIDANLTVTDSVTNPDGSASSTTSSGLHATPSQLADKLALKIAAAGGNMQYKGKYFNAGLTGLVYEYSLPIEKDDSPQNQFEFEGTQNYNLGADWQARFKGISWFGEAGLSKNGATALVTGALFELSSLVSTTMVYRRYDTKYQAAFANGFGETSGTQNESGLYFGAEVYPVKRWKISGYYDVFEFPWLRSGVPAPSKGHDYLVQADLVASRQTQMYWRVAQKQKEESDDNDSLPSIGALSNPSRMNLRYNISYQMLPNLRFQNRLEYCLYANDQTKEKGLMLFHDVVWSPFKTEFDVVARMAVYNTDSYNTRIYTYESDVLNAYSVPALYGRGTRLYLMLRYSPTAYLDAWVRYGQTYSSDREESGSGADLIAGHTKSEVKFQVRFKF